jgi:NAD(P)H-dependent FMN reductase
VKPQNQEEKDMKLTIINSSPRQKSQSGKIADYLHKSLSKREGIRSQILELSGNPLPLWDESIWDRSSELHNLWGNVQSKLLDADGFILVVPEWGGMVPPGLKNLFLLSSGRELGHKPALIVAISSSRNGSYPVAELRMSSYKNNRILYIPEQLIIRDVDKLFNEGEPTLEQDIYLRQRTEYSLDLLLEYSAALRQVRASGVVDYKAYPNGM